MPDGPDSPTTVAIAVGDAFADRGSLQSPGRVRGLEPGSSAPTGVCLAFRLAAEVGRADAPAVEAAADGERETAVDPSLLEEVRDGLVVTVWRADQECR